MKFLKQLLGISRVKHLQYISSQQHEQNELLRQQFSILTDNLSNVRRQLEIVQENQYNLDCKLNTLLIQSNRINQDITDNHTNIWGCSRLHNVIYYKYEDNPL